MRATAVAAGAETAVAAGAETAVAADVESAVAAHVGTGDAPADRLYGLITGYYLSSAIFAATSLGVPDALGDEARTPEDVAGEVGAHPAALARLLKLLAAGGIVEQRDDDRFALSKTGQLLRAEAPQSFRSVALQFAGPLQQRTWGSLEQSIRTGAPVFEQVAGTSVFSFFAQNPDAARVFDEAMSFFGGQIGDALVRGAYDFGAARVLVDVGGGRGSLLTGVLKAHPDLRGVLFELPHVAEAGRRTIESAGLGERCEVHPGDFFVDDLPTGGDLYLLKSVIHDFDDERAAAILRNCRRAMGPDSRLLIVEPMLPDLVEPGPEALRTTGSDINMLVHLGGRERSESEMVDLVESCGFAVAAVIPVGDLPSGLTGTSRLVEAAPA